MVKQYVFLDESGDLGQYGSTYFVVAVAVVFDPKILERIIKKIRKNKMKKSIRQLAELKANNTNPTIKRRVYEKIAKSQVEIYATAIRKERIRDDFYSAKEKFYNYICTLLLALVARSRDELEITIDQKSSNRMLMNDINEYIERKLLERFPKLRITIRHADSQYVPALQVVDFISWAVFRRYTHGDSTSYDQIKSKIRNAGSEELWK